MFRFVHIVLLIFAVLLIPSGVQAIEISLSPDSLAADDQDTLVIDCRIEATTLMRSFTVYLAYDTNLIKLAEPPEPGPVIANQTGLDFNYFDHTVVHPNRLEVTATVFGTDFWSGPGVLFTMKLAVRECGDAPITAASLPFLIDFQGNFSYGDFIGSVALICDRIPESVIELTGLREGENIRLRWPPVLLDTLNRPLIDPPVYTVFRSSIFQSSLPAVSIGSVTDTTFLDPFAPDNAYEYYVVTSPGP